VTGQSRRTRPLPAQPAPELTLQQRLDAIAQLHSQGPSGWCPACLLEHPCRTYQLATGRES
jgi:hypothetical protein